LGAAQFSGFSKRAFACGHVGNAAMQIKPASYQALFFGPLEYRLVERLADIIIPSDRTPGAREAGVAEFIDFMVANHPSAQYKFRSGLGWVNAHAERLQDTPFLRLTPDEQVALLEPLAYNGKHRPGEEDGREFFRPVRQFVGMGFYTSEIGFKELDNPALKFYADSPECPHQDDPEHLHLPPEHS
jgi:gluconate 2-dehydrogenase gamma chain